ncbi:MAG: wax ester/triacylglycerol synthase family O-acyltransferase [Terriglobales bacterium]
MTEFASRECLSFGDALFLYLEREGMPLNVASISTFDGVVPLKSCREFVETKLHLVPRYRQRVVAPPLNIGLPSWEYDPHFDIRNHIREARLRGGTDAEFRALVAEILSATMDRSRPLWDFTLVQGLQRGRTGLIVRVHHCLADGISGVGLMKAVLDESPDVRRGTVKPERVPVSRPLDTTTQVMDGVVTACLSAVQRVLTAHSEMLAFAQQLAHVNGAGSNGAHSNHALPASKAAPEELTRFLPELAAAPARLPFNMVCRGPQKFQWAEIPFAEIREVKRACDATVNDVILTVVTSAIRRYCQAHGVDVRKKFLRIIVPVSIRTQDESAELGNRLTFLPVPIPFGARSPRKLLAAVHERTMFLKNFRVAEMVGFAGTLVGLVPTAVQAMLGPLASSLPISVGNLICTNVPGPQQALYLLGHQMLTCHPYVPIGGEFGLNCAVLTYNGTAYFGFSGDAQAAPDIHHLRRYTRESFAELKADAALAGRPRLKRVALAAVGG